MTEAFLFTSESVGRGHPDKLCDQISDSILDLYLKKDLNAKVAIEALVTDNNIIVAGEVRSKQNITQDEIKYRIIDLLKEVNYPKNTLDPEFVNIQIFIKAQSQDIAIGVDLHKDEIGAGDQGLMFGFASNEHKKTLMPLPIMLSHLILSKIDFAVKNKLIKEHLGPDAKSQVTFEYLGNVPIRINTILVSIQHKEGMSSNDVKNLIEPIIREIAKEEGFNQDYKLIVNPTGQFVIGGPKSDTGLTGRKIIVDTYGGSAPHGGGAFSGKDATKVDRSAAYMARFIAKNIVHNDLAQKCLVQIAYAIGIAKPISFLINTFDTSNNITDRELERLILNKVDLRPGFIIERLDLKKPIYLNTAYFGHFGKDNYSWEQLNLEF
jgi:S-adenosylmethionine synthetase